MGNSPENLQAAFAGESQANRRYLFFAEKAEKEGQPQIARLFRAVAEAETVHARNHLTVIGIKSVREDLQAAIAGEHYEFTEMYPAFIKQAKADKAEAAEISFDRANRVEKIHRALYQNALQSLEAGKPFQDEPYFVCQVCGNTVTGKAPDKCPICGEPASHFKKVE